MSINQNFPEVSPSLLLDFANSRTLDPRITFTRSSIGTYVASNGLIKTAAADEPRFDHDPETGESLGLLIEESRTNIQINSEDSTGYTTLEITPTVPGSVSSPDGQLNANIITPTATLDAHHLGLVSSTASNIAVSVYAKANTYRYLVMAGRGSNNASKSPVFDLQSGTVTEVAGSVWSASITPAGDNWYRCSVVATSGSGGAVVGVVDTATSHSGVFLADGTSNLYVWGFQVEESSSFPTSYIPTSGSTVTRQPDNASITGSNFSDWYSPNPQTWIINYDTSYLVSNIHNPTILNLGATAYQGDIAIRVQNNNNILFWEDSGGGSPVTFINSTFTGQNCLDCKYAIAVDLPGGNLTQSVNGLSDYRTFTAEPFKNSTQMFLGNATGSSFKYLNGHINKLAYYPQRLTDSQLQNLTK